MLIRITNDQAFHAAQVCSVEVVSDTDFESEPHVKVTTVNSVVELNSSITYDFVINALDGKCQYRNVDGYAICVQHGVWTAENPDKGPYRKCLGVRPMAAPQTLQALVPDITHSWEYKQEQKEASKLPPSKAAPPTSLGQALVQRREEIRNRKTN